MRQVRYEILDHRHMRQGINRNFGFSAFAYAFGASQRIGAVDIHRTRTTNTFTARAAKSQCWINFIFDLDQCVQHHRATTIHIDVVSIDARVGVIVGIPAINLEAANVLRSSTGGEVFTFANLRVFWKRELCHKGYPIIISSSPHRRASIVFFHHDTSIGSRLRGNNNK